MSCGDAYAHLVRTKTGLTDENPYGYIEDGTDVLEWAAAGRELEAIIEKRWKMLVLAETGGTVAGQKATAVEKPRSSQLASEREKYLDGVQAYPTFVDLLGTFEYAALVDSIRANMKDGTCLLEKMDEAIRETNITPPSIPTKPQPGKTELEKSGDWFGTALATVAVGGLIAGAAWFGFQAMKG